jgi:tetratricopeptide (TPR) repeat protein
MSLNQFAKDPYNPETLNALGLYYEQSGRHKEALKCYQRALDINPEHLDALTNKAKTLETLNYLESAIETYGRAIKIKPHDAMLHNRIGLLYKRVGLLPQALDAFKTAISLSPHESRYHVDLGNLLHEEGLVDEAIACYRAALYYNVYSCEAHNNLAIALKDNHRLQEAFTHFEIALAICPDSADIHWNYALALLLGGRYLEGFREHEWRWFKEDYRHFRRDLDCPLWDGSATGDTILVYGEQGLGDVIHFIRYARPLKEMGFKVSLQCHRELKALFSRADFIDEVFCLDDPLPSFHYHCPLMSLPYLFKTTLETVPSEVPYIRADAADIKKWASEISNNGRLKVGLTWAGSKEHRNDRNRSMHLGYFEPLLRKVNADFYSLQKGEASVEAQAYSNLIDFTDNISDFADTAAIISLLDLVITVDTAVAHLAGAMGKEVWILLPYSPDWRWMLQRTDSPWYPTARLFRQPQRGDWHSVVDEVIVQCSRLS